MNVCARVTISRVELTIFALLAMQGAPSALVPFPTSVVHATAVSSGHCLQRLVFATLITIKLDLTILAQSVLKSVRNVQARVLIAPAAILPRTEY